MANNDKNYLTQNLLFNKLMGDVATKRGYNKPGSRKKKVSSLNRRLNVKEDVEDSPSV